MKLLFKLFSILLTFFIYTQPTFAMYSGKARPVYMNEIKYLTENKCKAIAIIPYSGMTYYTCPSGEDFWSEVLVESEGSPLSILFKNRKKDADESFNKSVAISTVMY